MIVKRLEDVVGTKGDAHGEDASAWPAEDIAQLKALIKTE